MFQAAIRTTILTAALATSLAVTASTAHANPSCNNLISLVRNTLIACGSGSACVARVQHTTTFFQHVNDFTDVQRTSWGFLTLRNSDSALSGDGSQLRSDLVAGGSPNQPFDVRQPRADVFNLNYALGLVSFNFMGTFDPVCFGDRFMILTTSTSIETYTFSVPNLF